MLIQVVLNYLSFSTFLIEFFRYSGVEIEHDMILLVYREVEVDWMFIDIRLYTGRIENCGVYISGWNMGKLRG